MQRQSRHNRLVVNTPDTASCDVFNPCPPGWTPGLVCPSQPTWDDPSNLGPVLFGIQAAKMSSGGGETATGYIQGFGGSLTTAPPDGDLYACAVATPPPNSELPPGALAWFFGVSLPGPPPEGVTSATVTVAGAAGASWSFPAEVYEEEGVYSLYTAADQEAPAHLLAGATYCVTVAFDPPAP